MYLTPRNVSFCLPLEASTGITGLPYERASGLGFTWWLFSPRSPVWFEFKIEFLFEVLVYYVGRCKNQSYGGGAEKRGEAGDRKFKSVFTKPTTSTTREEGETSKAENGTITKKTLETARGTYVCATNSLAQKRERFSWFKKLYCLQKFREMLENFHIETQGK